MSKETERQILEIIATDRIDIPISSMSGKLKRAKPKLAKAVDLPEDFFGDRTYARIEKTDEDKARGMKEGIEKFEENFPRYGRILRGYIEEQRKFRETHLYFGMNSGCRLTSSDYMSVMKNLGFTEATAERLYPELMDISRKMSRKRGEERSIMVDSTLS